MRSQLPKLLVKIFLLVLPVVLVLGYWEFRLWHVPNSYNTKRRHLESQLGRLQVLVLGSSQALQGIDPEYFSRPGFNLANVSQSLYYDAQLGLRYAEQMPRLKVVLIGISYFSFGFQLEDSIEAWRAYYYYHFWGVRPRNFSVFDPQAHSLIALYSFGMAQQYALKNFRVNLAEGYADNGWKKVVQVSDERRVNDLTGQDRAQFHTGLIKNGFYAANRAYLEQLLKRLKERNIAVVFVSPPVYNTYRKFTDSAIDRLNEDQIKSLCREYGCGYYDYQADGRFTLADFDDNDHLNYQGAEKLSRLINSEVLAGYFKGAGE